MPLLPHASLALDRWRIEWVSEPRRNLWFSGSRFVLLATETDMPLLPSRVLSADAPVTAVTRLIADLCTCHNSLDLTDAVFSTALLILEKVILCRVVAHCVHTL